MVSSSSLCYSVVAALALLVSVQGQGMMGGPPEDKGKVLKKDLPYIACSVCSEMVNAAEIAVTDARQVAPYQKLDELEVQEILDTVCLPKHKHGEWMRSIDIQQGDDLRLVFARPGGVSKCEHECKTIAHSCKDILDDVYDDFSAALWRNKEGLDLVHEVCQDWADVCHDGLQNKRMKKSRVRKDYPYRAMDQTEFDMEQLQESMGQMGMGGSMLTPEMMAGMGGDPYGDSYGDPYGDPYGGMGGMGGGDSYVDPRDTSRFTHEGTSDEGHDMNAENFMPESAFDQFMEDQLGGKPPPGFGGADEEDGEL